MAIIEHISEGDIVTIGEAILIGLFMGIFGIICQNASKGQKIGKLFGILFLVLTIHISEEFKHSITDFTSIFILLLAVPFSLYVGSLFGAMIGWSFSIALGDVSKEKNYEDQGKSYTHRSLAIGAAFNLFLLVIAIISYLWSLIPSKLI